MAKGTSSSAALKRILHHAELFIATWGQSQLQKHNAPTTADWPAPYRLAILRGEATLRLRFFDHFIPSLSISLDSAQTLALWQNLVEDAGHLTDFIHRSGMQAALRRQAPIPEHAAQESRELYAMLVGAADASHPELVPIFVDQLMLHQWRQRFPNAPSHTSKTKKQTPAEQRAQLLVKLRKQHNATMELRESFTQETEHTEQTTFKLLTRSRASEPWQTLIELTRPRLTTARNAAYEAAQKQLQSPTA
jgi:hypothetical protein